MFSLADSVFADKSTMFKHFILRAISLAQKPKTVRGKRLKLHINIAYFAISLGFWKPEAWH